MSLKIPLPLLENKIFVARCMQLNSMRFNEERYKKFLRLFQTRLQGSNIEDLNTMRKNCSSIPLILSEDLKRQSSTSVSLNTLQNNIDRAYFLILKNLQSQLKKSYDQSRLDTLHGQISHFEKLLPAELKNSELKAVINKCINLYCNRSSLLSFVSFGNYEKIKGRINRSIYPILSIDGGGIRGIIPIYVLRAIEKITRSPIADIFKLIGGTSTGGILGLALSKRHEDGSNRPQFTAQDLLDIYTQENHRIFQPNPHLDNSTPGDGYSDKILWAINHPKYMNPSIFFDEKFGASTTLSASLTDVLITTNSLDESLKKGGSIALSTVSACASFISGAMGDSNPSIFSHDSIPKEVHFFTKRGFKSLSYSLTQVERAYPLGSFHSLLRTPTRSNKPYRISTLQENDFKVTQVAQMTSAAPTFFPPVFMDNKMFMDGGLLQNNPAIPCVFEAFDKGCKAKDLFMLSLGTGDHSSSFMNEDLASSIVSTWFHITQPDNQAESALASILHPGAYHRIQYHFEEQPPSLDDIHPEIIQLLEEIGAELVENNDDLLRDICKLLKPQST